MPVVAPPPRRRLQERVSRAQAMSNDAAVQRHRAWRMRCEALEMRLRLREQRRG